LAPVELTRLALPGMVERGCGHVVHVSSIAGPFFLPHATNYATSKAALVKHALSLRAELRGSGVSASAVYPGFVRGEGAFVAYRDRAPWYLLENRPASVGVAVVKAIRRDRPQVIVNRIPLRPMLGMLGLAPRLTMAFFDRLGLAHFTGRLAGKQVPYNA
jgi:short-subunit dehydrogenase